MVEAHRRDAQGPILRSLKTSAKNSRCTKDTAYIALAFSGLVFRNTKDDEGSYEICTKVCVYTLVYTHTLHTMSLLPRCFRQYQEQTHKI